MIRLNFKLQAPLRTLMEARLISHLMFSRVLIVSI